MAESTSAILSRLGKRAPRERGRRVYRLGDCFRGDSNRSSPARKAVLTRSLKVWSRRFRNPLRRAAISRSRVTVVRIHQIIRIMMTGRNGLCVLWQSIQFRNESTHARTPYTTPQSARATVARAVSARIVSVPYACMTAYSDTKRNHQCIQTPSFPTDSGLMESGQEWGQRFNWMPSSETVNYHSSATGCGRQLFPVMHE